VNSAVLQEYKDKFIQQVGNDLNTSMGVTALYDALKAKANDATKLAILDSFDTVLSLSLLKRAASVREANAKAQSAKAEGGYTVTPPLTRWCCSAMRPKRPKTLPKPTVSGTS
jgi:cysteinyl-tRNA synthetase